MGRPSNTHQRRAQIVDGLLSAMASHGYAGATIPVIAQQAGLSPGLVHYHFDSKRDILLALIDRLSETLRERFALHRSPSSTHRDVVYGWIDAHLSTESVDPAAVASWVGIGAEAVRDEHVRAVYQQALGRVRKELEAGLRGWLQEEGRVTDNAALGAAALLSTIEGAYQIGVAAPDLLPPGYAAPMARQLARTWVAQEALDDSD